MAQYRDPLHPTDEEREQARQRLAASSHQTRTKTGFTPVSSSIEGLGDLVARAKARNAEREQQEREAFTGECFPCRDTGWLAGTLNMPCPTCPRGRAVEAERHRQRFQALWQEAGITPRCQMYSLASFPAQEAIALAKIRRFLAKWDGKRGLVLRGPYGTGKTGLLVGTLREVAGRSEWQAGRRIQFTTGTDLMDALRQAIAAERQAERVGRRAPTADYNGLLDRAKRVGLLAIDDLGAEKPTAFVQERLFAILNHRYEHLLPTFATTNYGLEQLATRIGPRVVERLIETCDVLAVEGANLRRERGAS